MGGKDVTVKSVKKKKDGKAAKAVVVKKPQASFFRNFFLNLGEEHPLPDALGSKAPELMEDSDGEEEEEDAVERLMEEDHDTATAVRDHLIQHAVRYFTGEMAGEEDEEEEEGSDEDEEDSDSDSSDSD